MATKKIKKAAAKKTSVVRPRKKKKQSAAKSKQKKKKAVKRTQKARPATSRAKVKKTKKATKARKTAKKKTKKKVKFTRAPAPARRKTSVKKAPKARKSFKPEARPQKPPPRKEKPPLTLEQVEMYKTYEEALRLLHHKKYRKAHGVFTQLLKKYPQETEVAARVNSFMRVCERQLESPKQENADTADEVFNQAVIHHNSSQYQEALDLYTRALKLAKKRKDHIYYALAATELSLGNTDNALKHLAKAIDMNQDNRFFAHNDPDFEPLASNQKFRELVRPG